MFIGFGIDKIKCVNELNKFGVFEVYGVEDFVVGGEGEVKEKPSSAKYSVYFYSVGIIEEALAFIYGLCSRNVNV